jgi:hypothetical protein
MDFDAKDGRQMGGSPITSESTYALTTGVFSENFISQFRLAKWFTPDRTNDAINHETNKGAASDRAT